MEKATGGKVKVNIYAADQLTNGNQSEGIQALMNGDPVQISMHSNLIYSAFDPRFNVVSLPFVYDSYDDADAKFDGEAGEKLKEILGEYGLHCMGIAENGFRELTNSKREIKSVDDMKNLKVRVAGSNLLMECYKRWGADATNMNWSETYTALQQNTVEGEENPLPAIEQQAFRKFSLTAPCGMQFMTVCSSASTRISTTASHHNSRQLLMNAVRRQLNTNVTSTVPATMRLKNAGNPKTA